MNLIQNYKTTCQQWRITAIVYGIQLALAFTLGMQVFEVMKASIGNSLNLNTLLLQYDHTVVMDFLKVHGGSITPLVGQLRWLLLVWMIIAVFLDAGMLYAATSPPQASGRDFWEGGARYFFKFLGISLFFLLLFLIWTGLLLLPIAMTIQPSLEYFSSEKYTVWLLLFAILLWLMGVAELVGMSVLSRLSCIREGHSAWSGIKNGIRAFRANKRPYMALLGCIFLFQVALMALYLKIEANTGFSTMGVLGLFGLQQLFSFLRVQLRQFLYVALTNNYFVLMQQAE